MILQSKPLLFHAAPIVVALPFLDVKLLSVTLASFGRFWAHFECDKHSDVEDVTYEFLFVAAERPAESEGWRYVATFERAGFEHVYARSGR